MSGVGVDIDDVPKNRLVNHTGDRFGSWTVVERTANQGTFAAWLCRCDCGEAGAVRGTDLRNGSSTNCGCVRREKVGAVRRGRTGAAHHQWAGDDIGYTAAHSRVKSARGLPHTHSCTDCGEQAEDWSYRGGCPAERLSTGEKAGRRYSPDPDIYDPRCRKCHWRFDGRAITRGEGGRFERRRS